MRRLIAVGILILTMVFSGYSWAQLERECVEKGGQMGFMVTGKAGLVCWGEK